MTSQTFQPDNLVLYKNRPARILEVQDRIVISTEDRSTIKVREKDISLLHPGPVRDLGNLRPIHGEVESAWQIMVESEAECNLQELAELIFGDYTPETAWAGWQLVEEGLYFHGTIQSIRAGSQAQVEHELRSRQQKVEENQAWEAFLDRAQKNKIDLDVDQRYLREVEDVALARRVDSRVLDALGKSQRPETAHALLLAWGCWDEFRNPYPARINISVSPPEFSIHARHDETRLDLTALPAYAIDDRGNKDPDDAISPADFELDGDNQLSQGRMWVHIADPASVVTPDSPADLEARQRGATFYPPEGAVPMLPWDVIHQFGLGLSEVSPALSIELELNKSLEPHIVQIAPSLVRVERISYEEAEGRLGEAQFSDLLQLAKLFERRRKANGAISPDLPEAIISVQNREVLIRPIETLQSRTMVREAMLMVGEAIARFSEEKDIPFPYTLQDPPDTPETVATWQRKLESDLSMSEQFAIRRMLKRSQLSTHPGLHAGLGLKPYTRFTSPLRRYLDLVAHQQIRRHIMGEPVLNPQQLLQRLGESEEASGGVARAESLSRRHWSLVYFLQHPHWEGEGILVDKNGMRGRLIIPELAFETGINLRSDLPLDSRINLRLQGVNLSEQDVYFS